MTRYYDYNGTNLVSDDMYGYRTDRTLKVLCLLIYTAVILGDVCETGWMMLYVFYTPHIEKVECLRYGEDSLKIKNGITRCNKFVSFVVVLIPKLLIGSVLLYYGGGYILGSKNNQLLLLNALAVAFIIELDGLMYTFSSSKCT
eukprot:UN31491